MLIKALSVMPSKMYCAALATTFTCYSRTQEAAAFEGPILASFCTKFMPQKKVEVPPFQYSLLKTDLFRWDDLRQELYHH